jgi:hypothetical protein
MEILSGYNLHMGPRREGAGLKIQLHFNQPPGIHFKVEPSESGYRRGIEKGLKEGAELMEPNFLKTAAIWVIEILEHPVDSSERAFYRAARLTLAQAATLKKLIAEGKRTDPSTSSG